MNIEVVICDNVPVSAGRQTAAFKVGRTVNAHPEESTTMPPKRSTPQEDIPTKVIKTSLPPPLPEEEEEETRSRYFPAESEEAGRQGKRKVRQQQTGGRESEKIVKQHLRGEPERRKAKEEKNENGDSALNSPVVPSADMHRVGRRLPATFFSQDTVSLAKALLGKVLVRMVDGARVSGRVVETEGYLGRPDAASHSHDGRRTPRNEPMYMKAGTSYVYSIYGMYYCFNVSSEDEGGCVLVRALEPLEGLEVMAEGRAARRQPQAAPLKPHQLCNGPSKLCQALRLTKESANKLDLVQSDVFWVEEEEEEEEDGAAGASGGGGVPECRVVTSTRVGIDSYGPESALKPLRFYVMGNKCVSVRDKRAEAEMGE